MIRNRPIFFYALALGVILTVFGAFAAMSFQGALRGSADQPQLQMAQQLASGIALGKPAADLIQPGQIDPSVSLQPFTILYDDAGTPVRSSGSLNRRVPVPPPGVFAYLRTHPTDKFTWQPQPGIRIAAVAQRIDGTYPGFLLAGRSLAVVQQQENQLRRATFITWFCLMALLVAGAFLLGRVQNASQPASAH